ncbi:MAG: hypothetical protein ACJA0X_002120 [Cyclobacteriaceae bacterium]|jgi:hypothetical protein
MKKFLAKMIAPLLVFGLILACDDEEITSRFDTLDIAPVVGEVTPNGAVKVGVGFDIVVSVSDGEQSPLASVSITLKDADGESIGTTTSTVSGTSATVTWAAADNGSAALAVGDYTITVIATDAVSLSSAPFIQAFNVFDLPFNANYPQMYILGSFTGWGGAADGSDREDYKFELIGDNLWELKGIDLLEGDEFKFSANPDFDATVATNEDWSDKDCDGVMESKTGGEQDGNTGCGFKGNFDILFNDVSFAYTMTPTVEIAKNVDELYMLGSFNSFAGSADYQFSLDADNTWTISEVILKAGDQFFFAEGVGLNNTMTWGDNEPDDVADAGGAVITIPSTMSEAFYKVSFNDNTLAYQFEFIKFPSISIIGSATTGDDTGWGIDTNLRDFGDGTFRHVMALYEGAFKYRANADWGTQWGGAEFPGGTSLVSGGGDVLVGAADAGVYIMIMNPTSGEISFTKTEVGIIGSATPTGWDGDTNMTQSGSNIAVWSITLDLVVGEFKIRTDELWDFNWGVDGYSTDPNYPVTEAGNYTVEINVNDKTSSAITLTKN